MPLEDPRIAFRLVGVLHLPPLPGAVNYDGRSVREIAEAAAQDAVLLAEAGFTHVMVQDASDNPQPTLAATGTIASLAVVGARVAQAVDIPLGVVVGHNDGPAAVAIAHAIGARFVRVKVLTGVSAGPSGFIQGCAVEVAAMKRLLGSDMEVWADAHEATSASLAGSIEWAAAEALSFGGADTIVVTKDSGVDDALTAIAALRERFGPSVPFVVGGRATVETMPHTILGSDGVIVGSALKDGSGHDARIDPQTARAFGATITQGTNA
jgi:membrane complex biogenesis BtpA family protein